jgi:hypothetical protein
MADLNGISCCKSRQSAHICCLNGVTWATHSEGRARGSLSSARAFLGRRHPFARASGIRHVRSSRTAAATACQTCARRRDPVRRHQDGDLDRAQRKLDEQLDSRSQTYATELAGRSTFSFRLRRRPPRGRARGARVCVWTPQRSLLAVLRDASHRTTEASATARRRSPPAREFRSTCRDSSVR